MKILLAAINSRYNHTNLAIRSIACYVNKHSDGKLPQIKTAEYTINQMQGDILRSIFEEKPDVLMFSVYIWNVEMTLKIVAEIKKILP
ncbi:MAG: cobalamin B12-binding domain-containing protein, partial [Treponemataceae bacterium]|nr:cobalamin B12-binding domain-containing protein [Treponemataceae bacterium]